MNITSMDTFTGHAGSGAAQSSSMERKAGTANTSQSSDQITGAQVRSLEASGSHRVSCEAVGSDIVMSDSTSSIEEHIADHCTDADTSTDGGIFTAEEDRYPRSTSTSTRKPGRFSTSPPRPRDSASPLHPREMPMLNNEDSDSPLSSLSSTPEPPSPLLKALSHLQPPQDGRECECLDWCTCPTHAYMTLGWTESPRHLGERAICGRMDVVEVSQLRGTGDDLARGMKEEQVR
jgi:hypothetical protein